MKIASRSVSILAVVAFTITLALPAIAARKSRTAPVTTQEGPTETQQAIRALRRQIRAEELAIALNLDEEQTERLAVLVQEQVDRQTARKTARQADQPEVLELLEDYLDGLVKNGSPDDKTVAALKELREGHKPDRQEAKGNNQQAHQTLLEVLTEDQQKALREFKSFEDIRPGQDERLDRQQERQSKRGKRGGLAGEPDAEERRMKRELQQRKQARKRVMRTVREVLFSPEMLGVLTR